MNCQHSPNEREADSLRAANGALIENQAAIQNLLDNVEQGFLTIDRNLVVGPQFSAACESILGLSPAGQRITDLLYPTGGERRAVMSATLASVLAGGNRFAQELKLELLPKEFELDARFIKAGYKLLADPGALMLILTDVTETTLLAREVECERKRLEMVVLAFTEGEAFAALVNDYRRFLQRDLRDLVARIDQEPSRSELYRRLHTFKGLLAQFGFSLGPASIHDVETRLAESAFLSGATAFEALGLAELATAFELDLASVSELLGAGFDAPGGRVLVAKDHVRAMEQLARAAIACDTAGVLSGPLRMLLQSLAALGSFNVKSALGLHSRGFPTLASRLGKELEPVIIEGDDVTLAPERYGDFFRSLVHVFRNAVDHGIETPVARIRAGKQAEGSIRCVVRDRGGVVEILVADDGAGIDRTALERKLTAHGEDKDKVERLTLSELVFREGLSSRETAGIVSGRGVGMAAVKAELDWLGGAVAIETIPGMGTEFTFTVPQEAETPADDGAVTFERMAV